MLTTYDEQFRKGLMLKKQAIQALLVATYVNTMTGTCILSIHQ